MLKETINFTLLANSIEKHFTNSFYYKFGQTSTLLRIDKNIIIKIKFIEKDTFKDTDNEKMLIEIFIGNILVNHCELLKNNVWEIKTLTQEFNISKTVIRIINQWIKDYSENKTKTLAELKKIENQRILNNIYKQYL